MLSSRMVACEAVLVATLSGVFVPSIRADEVASAILYRKVTVPQAYTTTAKVGKQTFRFGGDVRLGDLNNDGRADLLVFRCDKASELKPCFLGAFDLDGKPMWSAHAGDRPGGSQPLRPGSVAIHDIDADGKTDVVCFWHVPTIKAGKKSMADVVVQIREGATGELKRQAAPPELRERSGWGPNWCHHRILICNLRGTERPRDFVVKLGDRVVAFNDKLEVLWTYRIRWNDYGKCSAYIPCVGDIDGDGRDEVNGGYFLLDSDGRPMWAKKLGPHMDSVAITAWDGGTMRAICSGGGHVMTKEGEAIVALGPKVVPHGQEARVADFDPSLPGPEMVIRYAGHTPKVMLVSNPGKVVRRFEVNSSPNETGLEAIYWHGRDKPALLYNGGLLFDAKGEAVVRPPELPPPVGDRKMGWYHCIPANVCGDEREEIVLYNPWTPDVYIYTPAPLEPSAYRGYRPGPRQANVRLMD